MVSVNIISESVFKGVKWLLFSFLFTYILLRVIFVDTLHDEIASYIFYFYHGNYMGDNIQWDANNHLLNSFIGHQIYKVFGDNFIMLRLPNLFAFIVYFFGTVQLLKQINNQLLKSLGLIALNTIPFILEYFGNARGYGLAIAFFIWGIVFILRYFRTYEMKYLILSYGSLLLTVAANLTYLISALIILAIAAIYPFINYRFRIKQQQIREWFIHALYVLFLLPFIQFSFALRMGGALYYGGLEGIWDVTGKTLFRYVLFYDADWLMYATIIVVLLFLIGTVIILRRTKFSEWLQQPITIIAALFFGNIIGSLILANFLDVNYPEDRTAMYLVPLFLLSVIYLLDRFPSFNFAQFGLLFFPISFLFHINLNTSVLTPDDRFDHEFYAQVKTEIDPENSIMIYRIMNWNWPYLESHEEEKASVAQFSNPNTTLSDIIITKTTVLENDQIPVLYDTIAYHPESTYIAFKRKKPMIRSLIAQTDEVDLNSNAEYINIAAIETDSLIDKNIELTVSGHLKTIELKNRILLVVQSVNKEGKTETYHYYSFETAYQGQLIDDTFNHHFILESINPKEKQIKVYLWNRGLHDVELLNASCKISELKSPENESR